MAFKMRGNPFKQDEGGQLLSVRKKKCPHCTKVFFVHSDGTYIVSDGGMAEHIASEHKDVGATGTLSRLKRR